MLPRHALKILGLDTDASEAEIRAAWRKKARLFHPDSPYANLNAFLQAQAAFEVLCPKPAQALKTRIRVAARSRQA